jgi:hypothetical protein
MSLDLALLATLKEKLVAATNFSEVLDYFLTHFGHNPEFIKLGQGTTDSFLEQIIAQAAGHILKGNALVASLRLMRLPEHHFIHGGGPINACLATVIYFEDITVGLLALASPFSPNTELARFTGRKMPRPGPASPN